MNGNYADSIGKFFEGSALLIATLFFFTIFSYYMPKGRKAMSGLSGAVCATFLVEVFNFWVLGNIPVIGNFTKVIGSFAGLLAAPGCAILVIILMGGNPVYALMTGTAVFAIGLSIDQGAIVSALAKTLVDSSSETGKAALNDGTTILAISEWIKGNSLNPTLQGAFDEVKPFLLTTDHGLIIGTIFNLQHFGNFAMYLKSSVGMFNILAGLVAGYSMYWVLKLIEKYSPPGLDLLIALLFAAPAAAGLALLGGNLVSPLLGRIGQTIETATRLTPIPMAIIVGGFLTIVGTSPLSSMALAVAIQLQGSAMAVGSVAAMGSSFMNGVLFAKMRYGERKNTIACAIEPLSQADIISLNPISVYTTNFIGGALSGVIVIVYGINILGIEQQLFMQSSGMVEIIQGFSQQGVGLATPMGPIAMFGQGNAQTSQALTANSVQYSTPQLQMHLGILLGVTAVGNVGAGFFGAYLFRNSYRVTAFEIYQRPIPIRHQYLLDEIKYFQTHKYRLAISWKIKIYYQRVTSFLNLYIGQLIKSWFYYLGQYLKTFKDSNKQLKIEIFTNQDSKTSSAKNNYRLQKTALKSNLKTSFSKEFHKNFQDSKSEYNKLTVQLEEKKLNLKITKKLAQVNRKAFKQEKSLKIDLQKILDSYQENRKLLQTNFKNDVKMARGFQKIAIEHQYKMSSYQLKNRFRHQKSQLKPNFTYLIN